MHFLWIRSINHTQSAQYKCKVHLKGAEVCLNYVAGGNCINGNWFCNGNWTKHGVEASLVETALTLSVFWQHTSINSLAHSTEWFRKKYLIGIYKI